MEIRCVTCHGTPDKAATLVTVEGNKLTHVTRNGDRYVLTAKLTAMEHMVPQLNGARLSQEGHTAMVAIPRHMEKLECYACHARWAPQCHCHSPLSSTLWRDVRAAPVSA